MFLQFSLAVLATYDIQQYKYDWYFCPWLQSTPCANEMRCADGFTDIATGQWDMCAQRGSKRQNCPLETSMCAKKTCGCLLGECDYCCQNECGADGLRECTALKDLPPPPPPHFANQCPWLSQTQSTGELECNDNTKCYPKNDGWDCCLNRLGRKKCMLNHRMCNKMTCGGGDYCCEIGCDEHGGHRACDAITPEALSDDIKAMFQAVTGGCSSPNASALATKDLIAVHQDVREVFKRHRARTQPARIEVFQETQKLVLTLFDETRTYDISTSRHGSSNDPGSGGTPYGSFYVYDIFGHDLPSNAVLSSRLWTGELHTSSPDAAETPDAAPKLGRILWIGSTTDVAMKDRYIYITGVPYDIDGCPRSKGSIDMKPHEVVELFEKVSWDTPITIHPRISAITCND